MNKFLPILLVLISSCAFSQSDLKFIDLTEYAVDMPEFSLKDMNHGGVVYNSGDHGGAVFVLEHYFNGCVYCNQNAENVERLYQEFKGNKNIQILSVSVDCRDSDYDSWINKHHPSEPLLNDCAGEVADALGVTSFPTTIVFAPDGRQALKGTGVWSSSTYSRLQQYLLQVPK